jgi:4-hydroxybenzoyl-CoA thioesterase
MTPSRIDIVVDFADCDPARIVFYPRYFDWFDRATERMFRSRGMPWAQLFSNYRMAGLPIVDATARFLGPSRFGDQIAIESWVSEWRAKAFVVEHRIQNKGKVVVEGRELRVWGLRDPSDPDGMKAGVVPPEIIARFQE